MLVGGVSRSLFVVRHMLERGKMLGMTYQQILRPGLLLSCPRHKLGVEKCLLNSQDRSLGHTAGHFTRGNHLAPGGKLYLEKFAQIAAPVSGNWFVYHRKITFVISRRDFDRA